MKMIPRDLRTPTGSEALSEKGMSSGVLLPARRTFGAR
jgi:hypothetical protein